MNTPGTVGANWSWRLAPGQVTEELGQEVLQLTMRYGRANWDGLNRAKKAAEKKSEKEAEKAKEAK